MAMTQLDRIQYEEDFVRWFHETGYSFSEIHDCKKSQGKIVLISIDKTGNTYCGYCNQKINYKSWLETKRKEFESENGY